MDVERTNTMLRATAAQALLIAPLAAAGVCGLPDDVEVVGTARFTRPHGDVWEGITAKAYHFGDPPHTTEKSVWDEMFDGRVALPESPYCRYPAVVISAEIVLEFRVYRLDDSGLPTTTAAALYDWRRPRLWDERYERLVEDSKPDEAGDGGRCDLPADEATVAVWRTPSGCWGGCGPSGCTDVSKKELAGVLRLVYDGSADTLGEACDVPMAEGSARQLNPRIVTIHRLGRTLSHGDTNARTAWPIRDKGDGAVADRKDLREGDCHF